MRHIIYTLLVRRHYYKEKRYYVQNDRNLIEKNSSRTRNIGRLAIYKCQTGMKSCLAFLFVTSLMDVLYFLE